MWRNQQIAGKGVPGGDRGGRSGEPAMRRTDPIPGPIFLIDHRFAFFLLFVIHVHLQSETIFLAFVQKPIENYSSKVCYKSFRKKTRTKNSCCHSYFPPNEFPRFFLAFLRIYQIFFPPETVRAKPHGRDDVGAS